MNFHFKTSLACKLNKNREFAQLNQTTILEIVYKNENKEKCKKNRRMRGDYLFVRLYLEVLNRINGHTS